MLLRRDFLLLKRNGRRKEPTVFRSVDVVERGIPGAAAAILHHEAGMNG